MGKPVTIGFAGTDARTLVSALVVTQTGRNGDDQAYKGAVIRGTPAMPEIAQNVMGWNIDFIPTEDNSAGAYARAAETAFRGGLLDYAVPMPESLIFNGIVDQLEDTGFGNRVAGLTQSEAFIEADKIQCKEFCREIGVPVADQWTVADARSFDQVSGAVLDYLHAHGGAVLKFPYSAGGKGARIILDAWEIRPVYEQLIRDYKKSYQSMFRKNAWPLLIESRMSGMEISFTILVDAKGGSCILPTAMDYPERFSGPPSSENPITGGMGSISPHPFESGTLIEMVRETIAQPLVEALRARGGLRPCILYPGCFVSFKRNENGLTPSGIRVCEINIRPGEPEFQTVMRRLKNPGELFEAMFTGCLDQVRPEVRDDQISITTALVTGPGGPDGQKGYPWRVTRNEPIHIDFSYLRKKGLQAIPSAMGHSDEKGWISDGTRVLYLIGNGAVKENVPAEETARKIMNKVQAAYDGQRVRLVPREDDQGNRFDFRRDIGIHFDLARQLAGE